MSLFVSDTSFKLFCFTPARLKKTGLSATLLMLSLSAQAEPSLMVEKPDSHVQPDVQSLQQNSQSALVQDANGPAFDFPGWPQQQPQQSNDKIIPPPPPGPYASSALSDYSVVVPSSAHRSGRHSYRRPVAQNKAASVPIDMFSPDIPWPTNLRPQQRMPNYPASAKRYQYAQPSYSPAINSQNRNYNYGNSMTSPPYFNGTNMNGSRWMPAMGMAPPGPYNSRLNHSQLNYAPNYGSYYNPRYSQPMINNNATTSTKRPYR